MNGDELSERLRSVDGDVPLDEAAGQRVLTRMLDAFAATDPGTADVDAAGSAPGGRRDWPVWAARAAAVALIGGVVVGVAVLASDDDMAPTAGRDETIPVPTADSPPAEPAVETTVQPTVQTATATTSPVDDVINPFGYEPFTTYQYVYTRELPGRVESWPMTVRVGEFMASDDRDGVSASVRRSILGPDGGTEERSIFTLEGRAGGGLLVPLDWLDPPALGGPCVGGSVAITDEAASAAEPTATCAGSRQGVDVISVIGPAEQIELSTGPSVSARPLRIDIRIDNVPDGRQVTLWLTERELVRWEFGPDGSIARYDLDSSTVESLDDP